MEIVSLVVGLVFSLYISFTENGAQPLLVGFVVSLMFATMWWIDAILRGFYRKVWRDGFFFWHCLLTIVVGIIVQYAIGATLLPWWANVVVNLGTLCLGILGKTMLSNILYRYHIRTKEHYGRLPDLPDRDRRTRA